VPNQAPSDSDPALASCLDRARLELQLPRTGALRREVDAWESVAFGVIGMATLFARASEAALNVYAQPCESTRQIMTLEHFQALARYNRWMNEKIYTVAGKLTDEERKRDRGAFFKSIHATLNHILLADRVWMGRFTGVKLQGDWIGPDGIRTLDQELYTSFEELRDERVTMDTAIERWVTGLTADRLTSTLRYVRKQVPQECPLWWAVAHFFNHQTHHRGQVSTLLMQAGHDPGVTDLFAMFREETTATRS
jgi:uncharacterized damage-inducible protein DinB